MTTWTPYEIEIVLHHSFSHAPFPQWETQAYRETVDELIRLGVLKTRTQVNLEVDSYAATALGEALVQMWCEQPLPVATYLDPRFVEGQPR